MGSTMSRISESPLGLLLFTGILLGAVPPLGKLATDAGVSPLAWALVISGGVSLVLAVVLALRGGTVGLGPAFVRYGLVAGGISFALPNVLTFLVIPHLGAGYTGVMFTLSPVLTLAFSLLLGVRRPNALGMAGIALGFLGALIVAWTRGEVGRPADPIWIGLGLLIPVSLAAGNIYRTLDWPAGAGPTELAAGSHLGAAVLLLLGAAATGGQGGSAGLLEVPLLVVVQVAVSAAMFAGFFRLQAVGGPVYLSQIGYVGAAVGLLAGVLLLGERYGPATLLGRSS